MSDDFTIFYVADIHGSDVCFRKWLNAARFYGADVLIIGGDLTGKVLLPIIPAPAGESGWIATWRDRPVRLETRREVDELIRMARNEGTYGFLTTPDEVDEIHGSIELERQTFLRLKRAALEEWIAIADERLAAGSTRAYVMPGNDDPPEMDELLDGARGLRNVQGVVTELWPGITMASRGESTPTPWNTPRELSEADLGEAVRRVVDDLPEEGVTIWNLHMPPKATSIDLAPKLDASLRVRYDGAGEPVMVPVGSSAIRELVTERQPTLALHGHIHESRGRYKIGRTTGINPGSQYQDGVLLGVLVRVSARSGVRDIAFTAG
ncbi:MAG TPA: metallophosphoesterase [Candidatus Limnocylindria bacterium]|nr:metallophosphoesterase [Candidatus Limnocylindria bacterium]